MIKISWKNDSIIKCIHKRKVSMKFKTKGSQAVLSMPANLVMAHPDKTSVETGRIEHCLRLLLL